LRDSAAFAEMHLKLVSDEILACQASMRRRRNQPSVRWSTRDGP